MLQVKGLTFILYIELLLTPTVSEQMMKRRQYQPSLVTIYVPLAVSV